MPATVVSIYPHTFNDAKPGQVPISHEILGSEDAKTPTLTVIGDDCFYWRQIPLEEDPEQSRLAVPISAEAVAKAIVWDFLRASRLADFDKHPGLFYITGTVPNVDVLERRFGADLEAARLAQHLWFEALVKEADDLWNRFRQYRTIDDLHRMASKYLDLKREWAAVIEPVNLMDCPFCTLKISPAAVICPNCTQIVNSARYEELKKQV